MIYHHYHFPLSSIERGDIISLPGISLEVRQTTLACVDRGLQGLSGFWHTLGLEDGATRGEYFSKIYGRPVSGNVFPEFTTGTERIAICNALVELLQGKSKYVSKKSTPRIIDMGGDVFDVVIGKNKIRIHSPFFQIKEIQNAVVDNKKSRRSI